MNLPNSTFGQTVTFTAAVLVLAVLNSLVNPSAMDLGTDYFPTLTQSGEENSEGALPKHDFGVLDGQMVLEFLPDLRQSDFAVLIDARSTAHYTEGHIPGAYQIDRYKLDEYVPPVLPAMQAAGYVIIYCAGGDCEDSIFLATDLVYHFGLEKEVLYIYEGGMEEWEDLGHPIATGKAR
ncbi:MAG: rhodanese-like domain-containing protein [Planctomycetota bacterium]|nr:rhodanese-like domain-containing protein [Planctomycetota bacterium]MDA1113840.1 rhodanese-like domain-containing protein [Planctomycetota bacterium]